MWSETVTFHTARDGSLSAPGAPTAGRLVFDNGRARSYRWTAPTTGADEVARYRVQTRYVDSDGEQKIANHGFSTGLTKIVYIGRAPEGKVAVRVQAHTSFSSDDNKVSPWSPWSEFNHSSTGLQMSRVTTKESSGEIRLDWDAVSGATRYRYRNVTDDANASWNETTARTVTFSGLTVGGVYTFELQAGDTGSWGPTHTVTAVAAVAQRQEAQSETLLAGSFHDEPGSHDGTPFTFEFRLSEPVNLGYRAVRDAVIAADGASITSVRRLEQGSNQRWEITVTPDGSGDIFLYVPVTTSCDVAGAVCTADKRQMRVLPAALILGSSTVTSTPAPPPPPTPAPTPEPTAPSAPQGLTAAGFERGISLSWQNPGDAGITAYQFRVRSPGGNWRPWQDIADSGSATTGHRLPGLSSGVAYDVQLRVGNEHGWSEMSQTTARPR